MTARRPPAGLLLFLAVVLLYLGTYSSVPTSDGYSWIALIDSGDARQMVPAYHPLPMYVLFRAKEFLTRVGLPAPTLGLIQAVNSGLAGLGAVLQYRTIRTLGGGAGWALLGGGLLAMSFGYWYFANGELHHFSLILLQLLFLLLVRIRTQARPYGYGFLVGLGLLHALAVLFHQENFLFGFAAVALLLVGRPWRQGLIEALVYGVAGSLWTAVLAALTGIYLRGARSVGYLLHWFFWLFYSSADPQPYALGNPATAILKMVKGQLTALIFGTQVMSDVAREPMLLRSPGVPLLVGLTLVVYGIAVGFLLTLWSRRGSISPPWCVAATGCVVWILSYKVFLHSWFWPTAPEYQVVTLPPLILVLLLGPIAVRPRSASGRRPFVAAATLLVLLAVVNFQAGVLPWRQYGRMKEALADQLRTAFRPDDFFISSESGIDSVFLKEGNHLAVKELFKRSSKVEGFATIRTAVAERLARGQRVFVYNLVPSPFTLFGIQQAAADHGASLGQRDFEEFLVELNRSYAVVSTLTYWEESKAPLYLFGERSEVMWELKRKQPGAVPLRSPSVRRAHLHASWVDPDCPQRDGYGQVSQPRRWIEVAHDPVDQQSGDGNASKLEVVDLDSERSAARSRQEADARGSPEPPECHVGPAIPEMDGEGGARRLPAEELVDVGLANGQPFDAERPRVQDLDRPGVHQAAGIDEKPLHVDANVAHAEWRAVATLELAHGRGEGLGTSRARRIPRLWSGSGYSPMIGNTAARYGSSAKARVRRSAFLTVPLGP